MAILLACLSLFNLLMVVPSFMWSGYVLTVLWAWFVVPTFGLAPLSIAAAVGLCAICNLVTHHQNRHRTKRKGDVEPEHGERAWDQFNVLVFMAMKPAIALLIGFIAKQWM